MYFRQSEHNPPHVHAICGECYGLFSILNGEMFDGDIPKRDQKVIKDFILYYQEQLMEMWETQVFKKLDPIV